MLRLVIQQLRFDKTNSAITILALSFAIAVILIFQGFEQGQYEQLKLATINRGSDLIVVQSKVNNFMATRSVIPQSARESIEAVSGVTDVHPLTTLPVVYRKNGLQTPIYLIVFDTKGGPSNLVSGTVENRGNSIVIDETLAKKYKLTVSDTMLLSDYSFRISGITKEAAFMTPFAFINYDGLIDFFMESEVASDLSSFPLLSFLLIDTSKEKDIQKIQHDIEKSVRSVDVFLPDSLAQNDVSLGKGFYKPILGLLTAVGFTLGSLLICILMFSAVQRNQREFSIMLALGFETRSLIHYTLMLSGVLISVSFIFGIGLSQLIAYQIEETRPVYYFAILHPYVLLKATAMVLFFALIGAVFPYISMRKYDPVTALRNAT